jgi:hypothetical protein
MIPEHDPERFATSMLDHLDAARSRNKATIAKVADRILPTIAAGQRIHVTGTGHSTALVLETFFRAGGLACVNPITHPGLNPLVGAQASTTLEHRYVSRNEVLMRFPLVIALGIAAACGPPRAARDSNSVAKAEETAIREQETRWRRLITGRDTAGIQSFYTEDAIYSP